MWAMVIDRVCLILATTLLAACAAAPRPFSDSRSSVPRATNALWNDSGDGGTIGFWLYKDVGACPSIRDTAGPPLVFAPEAEVPGKSVKGLSVHEMAYCFAFDSELDSAR